MSGGSIGGATGGAGGIDGIARQIETGGQKQNQKTGEPGFDDVMNDAINEVSRIQQSADNAVQNLAHGGDMTQAIIEMQKADLNFQLMIEIRNRILNAYDQIMGMQM